MTTTTTTTTFTSFWASPPKRTTISFKTHGEYFRPSVRLSYFPVHYLVRCSDPVRKGAVRTDPEDATEGDEDGSAAVEGRNEAKAKRFEEVETSQLLRDS